MHYFATLNKTVIDGTECTKPSEYFRRRDNGKAICVEGICKVGEDYPFYLIEKVFTLVDTPKTLLFYQCMKRRSNSHLIFLVCFIQMCDDDASVRV